MLKSPPGMTLLIVVLLAATTVLATPDALETVPSVELDRYQGRWYEIARLPNVFQRDCSSDITATYELRDDGKIRVVNECKRANGKTKRAKGVARLAGRDTSGARLQVSFAPTFLSFVPLVWGDYWVVDLAPDYSWALIGDPDRKYLWVLSRSPDLDPEIYEALVERAGEQGFDVTRLIYSGSRVLTTDPGPAI